MKFDAAVSVLAGTAWAWSEAAFAGIAAQLGLTREPDADPAMPVYASRWGKYAINPTYVNSMALKYLGRPMTAQQYLSSPANQDLLGRAALTALYNQYGAKGAASSWYSGNPNLYNSTKAQPGGPSIADYVNSVLKRMGSAVDKIDLSSQPANSPISPWGMPPVPTVQSTPSLRREPPWSRP